LKKQLLCQYTKNAWLFSTALKNRLKQIEKTTVVSILNLRRAGRRQAGVLKKSIAHN
jgi:hypothetical protein